MSIKVNVRNREKMSGLETFSPCELYIFHSGAGTWTLDS